MERAIDDLFDSLTGEGALTQTEATRLINAYAGELAELLRKSANQYAMLRSERMQGVAEGLRLGAATVDPPEVPE